VKIVATASSQQSVIRPAHPAASTRIFIAGLGCESENALSLLMSDGSQGPVTDQPLVLFVPQTKRE